MSDKPKHTPGPAEGLYRSDCPCYEQEGLGVKFCALHAAAPELAEALRRIVEQLGAALSKLERLDDIEVAARAALKKAGIV